MIRNYKQEERLKEMGIKDPQKFMKYQMLENKNMVNETDISFNFIGCVIIIITLFFVYVL